jgi:hypothetical protein
MKVSMSANFAELGELEGDSAPIPMRRRRVQEDFGPDSDIAAGVPRSFTRRDARRFVIRLIGFAAVGGVIWGAVHIAGEPRARDEMASWGTLGNPRLAATAGRGVRSVVDTVRSLAK